MVFQAFTIKRVVGPELHLAAIVWEEREREERASIELVCSSIIQQKKNVDPELFNL